MKSPSPYDDFDAALRRDAEIARQRAKPSDGLAARITRVVHRSRMPTSAPSPRISSRWLGWSFAGVITSLVLAWMALQDQRVPASVETASAPTAPAATATATTAAQKTDWQTLLTSAETLLTDNALEHEVDALVSDGREALQFLALNFLPVSVAPEPAQRG